MSGQASTVPTTAQPGSPVRVLVPADGGPCHHGMDGYPAIVEFASGNAERDFGR